MISMNEQLDETQIREFLDPLFRFLSNHRMHNQTTQLNFFKPFIHSKNSIFEKTAQLLYGVVITQSQPKIDYMGHFFEQFHERFYGEELNYQELCAYFGDKSTSSNFESLFNALKGQEGWGAKTSALFVRNIYVSHVGYGSEYKFLPGAPSEIASNDRLYLPVDAVIRDAFSLFYDIKGSYFYKINHVLQKAYTPEEMEIWDDLWFWGFFGSKIDTNELHEGKRKRQRVFGGFNKNKYWAHQYTEKDSEVIIEVETLMKKFKNILDLLKQ